MARKKKTIVHLKYGSLQSDPNCGQSNVNRTNVIAAGFYVKRIDKTRLLKENERICHKCMHIHKLNLAKVK